jgi:hypothetical protein
MEKLYLVLVAGILFLYMSFMSYTIGKGDGRTEMRSAEECYCGQTQTCAFGPGIVGFQRCFNLKWSRCEPVQTSPQSN